MFSEIPDLTAKRAELDGAATAFRTIPDGTVVSYRELEENAQRAAGILRAMGVGAQDRVALICRNRVEFFEILFACAKLGAILVPLNWRMPAQELLPLCEDSQPTLLLYGSEDAEVAAALIELSIPAIDLDGHGPEGYRARRDRASPYRGRAAWPGDECWYLLYTSGTTGKPKAVIQTYGMAVANYVNIRQAMGLSGQDVTLNYLPLFHTAGINLVTLPALMEGGEVLMLPGFELEAIVDVLESGEIDAFFGVPACYLQLSQHPKFSSLKLGSIRSWGCGGAAISNELITMFLKQGASIRNGMGMTETGPTVFMMDEASVSKKIGSVGKPQLLAAVRIIDKDGNEVATGETGELCFAGPGVTPGYWQQEAASADVASESAWLKSGDLARVDADGYYYIVGRLKDMYISGGENVYAAEVERELAEHPDILEAAIVAIADEKWGEVGCAYVRPKAGRPLPVDEVIKRYCRERMAAYKVPKRFIAVEDFPRTAAGKIQKHLLSDH